MPKEKPAPLASIAYVASRLPELSETFVYREFLGLRARGYPMIAISVRRPKNFPRDPVMQELGREAFVIYCGRTLAVLPLALLRHPLLAIDGIADALRADHDGMKSRVKHIYQAFMGIAAGWRLRKSGIGHLHAHMASVPASLALYIARALGVTFSFTGHASDLFVNRAALAFKLRRAAFIACISHWHRDFYRQVAPLDLERLPIVRCGVEIPDTVLPESREIVAVARLVPKKGIDLLLEAFARKRPEGWTLRIVGDGPQRGELERLAEKLGIAGDVVWEGAQPHRFCLEAIRGAGIFVLPCRTAANGDKDGIPVVLMEAMAAARAVIAGDLPSIRELVAGEGQGILVPPDDITALAAAIGELASAPARRRELGAAARARVTEEFSDDVNLRRIGDAFERVRGAA